MNNLSSLANSPAVSPEVVKKAEDLFASWNKIRGILARELSEQSFKTWFDPVRCLELSQAAITLGVPDSYYGQWLKNHYHDLLSSAVEEALGGRKEIQYRVVEPPPSIAAETGRMPNPV